MAAKKSVTIEAIKKAEKMLSSLPPREPEKKMLDVALEGLKPQIEAALEKGYSQAELVELLGKQGVPVKAYHLRALLASSKAKTTPVGKAE